MRKLMLFLFLALVLAACADVEPTPTSQPEATAVADAEAVATTSPTAVATDTIAPTTAAAATDTAVPPTPTEEPTATAVPPTPAPPSYELTITAPQAQATVTVGQDVAFGGVLSPAPVDSVDIRILVGSRVVLSAFATVDPNSGIWSVTTAVSPNIVGPALLVVEQTDLNVRIEQPIELAPDPRQADPFITLTKPAPGDTAVAGYTFFMEGRVGNAIDDTVSIGVLENDCTTFAARISFELESGNWSGFVILPELLVGDVCAVAYTGSYGEGDWREARVSLNAVDPVAEPITLIELGNPDSLGFAAGSEVTLYGVAVAPAGAEVLVQMVVDNGGTATVLLDETAVTDTFGYWETTATLPADYSGPALLTVSTGEGDTYVEARRNLAITP